MKIPKLPIKCIWFYVYNPLDYFIISFNPFLVTISLQALFFQFIPAGYQEKKLPSHLKKVLIF